MSAIFIDSPEGLERTSDIVAANSDFSFSGVFCNSGPPAVGESRCFFYRGDDPVSLYTDVIGIFHNPDGTLQFYDSLTPSTTGPAVPLGWNCIQYTYTQSTGTHRVYLNGALAITVVANINAYSFTHEYIGTDTYAIDWLPGMAGQVREWDAVLSLANLDLERGSTTVVRSADLWLDTPLVSDLLDDSGNGYDWSQSGGTITFEDNPGGISKRFYFNDTDWAWLTGFATFRGSWDTNPTFRRRISQTKDQNSIAAASFSETSAVSGFKRGAFQLISDPLAAQTISGTFNILLGLRESSASANLFTRLHIWVSVGDTDTLRGTLLNQYEDASGEWPTTAQGTALGGGAQALSSLAVTEGDRLVIEIGYIAQNSVSTSFSGTINSGTQRANGDLTAGSTLVSGGTGLNGYYEFSRPILLAPAPANDRCVLATNVTSLPFTATVDATYATGIANDGEETYHGASELNRAGVWFRYVATLNGTIPISTEGSTYPVSVAVWEDEVCGALTEGGELIDGIDPTDASPLVVPVANGRTYLILVERWAEASGDNGAAGTLEFSIGAGTAGGSAPANDDCASPNVIASLPYVDAGVDTTGATTDGPTGFGTPYHSVHYEFTPGTSGHFVWGGTEADYDFVIRAYTGACGAFTSVQSQNNTGFVGVAGTTYHIMVHAEAVGGGTLTFRLREADPDLHTTLGGSVGIASDFGRIPLNIFSFPPIFIDSPGGFILGLFAPQDPGSGIDSGIWPTGLMVRYQPGGSNDHIDYPAEWSGGDPTLDGIPVPLLSDNEQGSYDVLGRSLWWGAPNQTLELCFQLSTRNVETGLYNSDGWIRVRVNGVNVAELEIDDIFWPHQTEPPRLGGFAEVDPEFSGDLWEVWTCPCGHLSSIYVLGKPEFATGFGTASFGAANFGPYYPSDYPGIPRPDLVERSSPAKAADDALMVYNRNFTEDPATRSDIFYPGGPWEVFNSYTSGPPAFDIEDIDVGEFGGTITVHHNGVVFSQGLIMHLSADFVSGNPVPPTPTTVGEIEPLTPDSPTICIRVSRRLGDELQRIWSNEEIDLYLLQGVREMCTQNKVIWDWVYPENLPRGFSFTASWELDIINLGTWPAIWKYGQGDGMGDGQGNYTTDADRRMITSPPLDTDTGRDEDTREGFARHTYPDEIPFLAQLGADQQSPVSDLPHRLTEMERGLWDKRTITTTTHREHRYGNSRYETEQGEVYQYTWRKDGPRAFRKIRVPNALADTYEIDGLWGIARDLTDLEYVGDTPIEGPDNDPTSYWGIPRQVPGEHPIGPFKSYRIWGTVRRFYRDGKNVRVEHWRIPFFDCYDSELPPRYRQYLTYYAMYKCLSRQGPGQDMKLANWYRDRWATALRRMYLRIERQNQERTGRMGGTDRIPNQGPPPRPRLPWPYPPRVR